MITVQVGEPKQRKIGDYWFDPTTKVTSRASPLTTSLTAPGLTSSGTSHQIVWTPITTRYSMTQALLTANSIKGCPVGTVFVEAATDIPHMWDGNSWVPAISANYHFPHPNPQIGDTWTEPMSQVVYIWGGQQWQQLIGGAGAPVPGFTITGAGPTGTIGNIGPVGSGAPVNHNFAPGYVYQGNTWVPAQGVVGASAAPLQVTPPSGWQVTTAAPTMTGTITIHGTNNDKVVEIAANGKVTFGPGYTPDTASDLFWQRIEHNYPTTLINTLRASLKEAHDKLQAFDDAGFKLPKKAGPFDPNSAWDAAMGIIK